METERSQRRTWLGPVSYPPERRTWSSLRDWRRRWRALSWLEVLRDTFSCRGRRAQNTLAWKTSHQHPEIWQKGELKLAKVWFYCKPLRFKGVGIVPDCWVSEELLEVGLDQAVRRENMPRWELDLCTNKNNYVMIWNVLFNGYWLVIVTERLTTGVKCQRSEATDTDPPPSSSCAWRRWGPPARASGPPPWRPGTGGGPRCPPASPPDPRCTGGSPGDTAPGGPHGERGREPPSRGWRRWCRTRPRTCPG